MLNTQHEELFFVLEGEISFWLDGHVIHLTPGGHGIRAAWRTALFQELLR